MPFNINEFVSNLNKFGIAKPSHFDVLIFPPSGLSTEVSSSDLPRELSFRAEQAELPGMAVTTTEYRSYGPQRKIAYGSLFEDTNMTFIASHNMREKVFFENWLEFISGLNVDSETFNIQYYDNYKSDIEIRQYNEKGTFVYGVKLVDAFPLNITAMALNRTIVDDFHRLTVAISYRRWQKLPQWADQSL